MSCKGMNAARGTASLIWTAGTLIWISGQRPNDKPAVALPSDLKCECLIPANRFERFGKGHLSHGVGVDAFSDGYPHRCGRLNVKVRAGNMPCVDSDMNQKFRNLGFGALIR
jgi:hypothetical protein